MKLEIFKMINLTGKIDTFIEQFNS